MGTSRAIRVDWSGITAVGVCGECGKQFGPWFTQRECSAFLTAHLDLCKPVKACRDPECDRPSAGRTHNPSYCIEHLAAAKQRAAVNASAAIRKRLATNRPERQCDREGCNSPHAAKGLCHAHWKQEKYAAHRAASLARSNLACTVESCEKTQFTKAGLCRSHVMLGKWERGEITPGKRPDSIKRPKRSVRLCSVEGCDRKHSSKGWCDKHYRAYRYTEQVAA